MADIPPPPDPQRGGGVDKMARAEADFFSQKLEPPDLSKLMKTSRAWHLHWITLIYFWLFALSGIATFLVILWNILTPWRFLFGDDLARAYEFLVFGGAGVFFDRASKSMD